MEGDRSGPARHIPDNPGNKSSWSVQRWIELLDCARRGQQTGAVLKKNRVLLEASSKPADQSRTTNAAVQEKQDHEAERFLNRIECSSESLSSSRCCCGAGHHCRHSVCEAQSRHRLLRRCKHYTAILGRTLRQHFLLLDSGSFFLRADQRNGRHSLQPVSYRASRADGSLRHAHDGSIYQAAVNASGVAAVLDPADF